MTTSTQRPISLRTPPLVRALAVAGSLAFLPCIAWGQADTTLPGWRATFKMPRQGLETPLPLRTPGVGAPLIPGLALQYWDSYS